MSGAFVALLFALFGATLVGVAVFPRRSLLVALIGCGAIVAARLASGRLDWAWHLAGEWAKVVNLFALLVGFAVVADHFEQSHLPERLPRVLPRGAPGCFALLAAVWLLSGVLDNIAAALIGATAASRLFARVHVGYAAAIVAAANAGGAGSVIGDTTTTMIWLDGVSARALAPAFLGAAVALLVFGTVAALQQARFGAMVEEAPHRPPIDKVRLGIVAATITALALTNVVASRMLGSRADALPLLGGSMCAVLAVGALVRPINWSTARHAARGALFLVALVVSASLLPVEALPRPSVATTVGLGFVSAVFDNIPLTKVALVQGGYDWPVLAYSVGFGGSMVWFGSSAGVAVAEVLPVVRSVGTWVRHGWHIPLAFLAGHAVMRLVLGWNP